MPASRSRHAAFAVVVSFSLVVSVVPAVAAAGPQLPLPDTMAAVGDSITQAASTGGSLGADYPQNSWSTGWSASVNSHHSRLLALGAQVTAHNLSVSGAKMVDLAGQMTRAAAVQPDYLTVLIGGNDVCTPTVDSMTSESDFSAQFTAAMSALRATSPATNVYVVSIPRVMGLWELFHNNWWARLIWSAGGVCQSLLANPTSTNQADVDRRATVDARNRAFNAILANVCAQFQPCHWDGNAAFNTAFTASDVSGDYFHPSTSGQAKLAAVSWAAGYAWPQPNQAPVASFTHACSGLTCTFDDTSTDADGTIVARSWSIGGSEDPKQHTFAASGTYSVALTVTDDDGATATASQSITVSAAPPPTMRIADLSATRTRVNSTTWRATVTIQVTTPAGAPVPGAIVTGSWTVGAPDTCTTSTSGSCSVVSDNLNRSNTRSVTFTVTGATHATYVYAPTANLESSITVSRP